jgi:tetratricopeptide (TPR) repeat protein
MTQRDDSLSGDHSPSAAALSDRAEAFALSGDLVQASALYRQLLAAQPDHPGAQRKLAFVLQSGGALEEAAACYRRAIALDSADARAHDELGRLIGLRGDMAAATEHLRAAIRLDPQLVSARSAMRCAGRACGAKASPSSRPPAPSIPTAGP